MKSIGLAAVAIGSLLVAAPASAQGVKIGILNDQSGVYADYGGKYFVEAVGVEEALRLLHATRRGARRQGVPAGERQWLSADEVSASIPPSYKRRRVSGNHGRQRLLDRPPSRGLRPLSR